MTHPGESAPPHLLAFIRRHEVVAEFLAPGVPMPTVVAAAAAIDVPEDQILKTILFSGDDGDFVVAIASGTRRVSRTLLAAASGLSRPRASNPDLVFEVTGFPAGGVAPIGLPRGLPVIVDTGVAALPVAFGGGGTEDLLLRILPADVIRLNDAEIARIVDV